MKIKQSPYWNAARPYIEVVAKRRPIYKADGKELTL